MESIYPRIQQYLPLSEMESGFFRLYQMQDKRAYQAIKLRSPEETSAFHKLVHLLSSEESLLLPETEFFSQNQNVALNFHHRFMPRWLHHHDFIEVQYMLMGQLHQTISGHPVALTTGDVCFISPEAVHDPQIYDQESLMVNLLLRLDTFHRVFSSSLAEDDIISNFFMRVLYGKGNSPYLLCHTGQDTKLQAMVLDMLDEQKNIGLYTDRLLRTMLEQFFIFLLRDHKDDFTAGAFRKKSDENILSILRYIQSHYAEITLSGLAKHFNYDEAYLSRTIHAYTGMPFSQMVIHMRLQRAATLLRSGNQSVAEIMKEVGYSDKTHFYRSFKKKYGTTPAQLRGMESQSEV